MSAGHNVPAQAERKLQRRAPVLVICQQAAGRRREGKVRF